MGALTLGALAVVALLAVQAEGTGPAVAAARPVASASATAAPSPSASAAPSLAPLPAAGATGSTRRVVYSIGARQVWLVDPKKNPQLVAAFTVEPGSVSPNPGSYTVYSRSATSAGTDGRQVEHVVRFTQQSGTVFGFSAAVDGATPAADPNAKTGGIRETRQDAQTLWDFAPAGTRVLVVA
ncbi:L,D-transpeptidase [Streptomyces tateyamensis]|uniref:L,D-transpeptidase n=1 Tax=Streptomyces tateyamensis TaxID=565073 RepID=UPI0015E8B573|nr:L,D-transpeptidase [Streptomyces tateyamensis]